MQVMLRTVYLKRYTATGYRVELAVVRAENVNIEKMWALPPGEGRWVDIEAYSDPYPRS